VGAGEWEEGSAEEDRVPVSHMCGDRERGIKSRSDRREMPVVYIARQIPLLDQRGSHVIQGELLVIPIEETLIYVQSLYLRAEGGRIPKLKRVTLACENQAVMEETLDRALAVLFGKVRIPLHEAHPFQRMRPTVRRGVGPLPSGSERGADQASREAAFSFSLVRHEPGGEMPAKRRWKRRREDSPPPRGCSWDDLDNAQRYFKLALAKDSTYAPAYEGLSMVWGTHQQMGLTPPPEAGPKGMARSRGLILAPSALGAYGPRRLRECQLLNRRSCRRSHRC
jgi:hypothetical protein